jgi:electron transfer flavoprotein alpha subunit
MEREHNGIWIFSEYHDDKIKKSTLELLGKGRELADKVKEELSAVLFGFGVKKIAEELLSYGVDKVYLAEHEKLKHYLTLPYTHILSEIIKKEKPEIVLFSADTIGRDLAPRIAARLKTGLTADCTDLDMGEYEDKVFGRRYENVLYQIRPAFGGDVIATIVTPEHYPQLATVRPGMFTKALKLKRLRKKGRIIHWGVKLKNNPSVEILEIIGKEREVNLEDAKIIVAGGRGVNGIEGFKLIKELANLLRGEVGATRGAVEAGWISQDHQIGLSGESVNPDIYIACGISGAIQHLVGIKNSKKIIAINKDPNAPIFDIADYGIIADIFEVIPKLIENIKKYNGKN